MHRNFSMIARSFFAIFLGLIFSHNLFGFAHAQIIENVPLSSPMMPLVTLVVNSSGDQPDNTPGDGICSVSPFGGVCTLRAALQEANATSPTAGTVQINFNIPSSVGPVTIRPSSDLPTITHPVVLDGTTQPGTRCVEWPPTLVIEIDGSGPGGSLSGLRVTAGNSSIRGFVINRFQAYGIELTGNGSNNVTCNFIGTDFTGSSIGGNLQGGIRIESTLNNIGGNSPSTRNLISGNGGDAVLLLNGADDNAIQGNFIGTTVNGNLPLSNVGSGIHVQDTSNNLIGGFNPNARNIIGANSGHGIFIQGDLSSNNQVLGNWIGLGNDGTTIIGNNQHGILLDNAVSTNIGWLDLTGGNVIAYNGGSGVALISGNQNSITDNKIYMNSKLGIDLENDGVTPNDKADADFNANGQQNFPTLLSASSQGVTTTVEGLLNSTSNTNFNIEFFESPSCDPSDYGEGNNVLGATSLATDANGNAAFTVTFPTFTPNNHFVTAIATDSDGNSSEFSHCARVGLNNVTWTKAHRLDLRVPISKISTITTATINQFLDSKGQSRWYKFSVQPGSRVTVTLTGLPANYDLTLFKDIQKVYDSINPPQNIEDLAKLGAEFAPDAYSPDAYSPDAYSPDAYSPDAYSPDAYSPDAYSPDAYSPDAYSPDAYSPDAYSPDAYSPDAYSPDAYSPDAYSPDAYSPDADAYVSAQARSVAAASAFDGTAGEGIAINTWNNTGDFYVRVRGRNGAFSPNASFHLEVAQNSDVCQGVSSSLPATNLTGVANSYKTIIVTDISRFAVGDPQLPALQAKLATLAARPEVKAVMVNVGADARVAAANTQADTFVACPYAKNLVAESVKAVIDRYRAVNPLAYVVIVGNDNVIPFFRYPDQASLANELNYVPPVKDNSASQASLRLGFILSQDTYGSNIELNHKIGTFPIPDLPVGRLVETPADVIAQVDAYLETASGVVPTPTSALVTGYDFLTDNAEAVQQQLELGMGVPADTLIAPRDMPPTDPAIWTATQLRTKLLGSRHDVIFLAGHFSASSALAADHATRILTSEVLSSSVNLKNTILFSTGCHSGYNIVNTHGISGVTVEPDWAQTFARKGATFIGGTGYQYGDTDFLKYSEQLYFEFSRALRAGTGPVSIGDALVAAKQAYLGSMTELRGIDHKALLISTLFGLPMLSVNMPATRYASPADPSIVPGTQGFAVNPGLALGLRYADVSIASALTTHARVLHTNVPTQTIIATYLEGPDGVVVQPGEPVTPLDKRNARVPGQMLRGVGFRGGSYLDTNGILPLTGAATTESRGVHIPFFTGMFYPPQPWRINYFDALMGSGSDKVSLLVIPAQYRSSSPTSQTGTLRRFNNMNFRLYYSNNVASFTTPQKSPNAPLSSNVPALAAPPSIVYVVAKPDGVGNVKFDAGVVGAPSAGIVNVWVTYTATQGPYNGQWQSLDLTQSVTDTTRWLGTLPLAGTNPSSIRYMIQAVNGVGLVALRTNLGIYFVPGIDPSILPTKYANPTTINISSNPGTGPYGDKRTFIAELVSGNEPLPNKRLTFALGSQSRQATTNFAGIATVELALFSLPGPQTLRVSFAGDDTYALSAISEPFMVLKQDTSLSFSSAAGTGQFGDPINLSTVLQDAINRRLISKTVFFVLGPVPGKSPHAPVATGAAIPAITNFVGSATVGVAPLPAGTYDVNAYFSGNIPLGDGNFTVLNDVRYNPSTNSASLVLTPENATVLYTGDAEGTTGFPLKLSALVSQEDDGYEGDITNAQVQFDLSVDLVATKAAAVYVANVGPDGIASISIPAPVSATYQLKTSVIGGYFTSPITQTNISIKSNVPTAVSLSAIDAAVAHSPERVLVGLVVSIVIVLGVYWVWRRNFKASQRV